MPEANLFQQAKDAVNRLTFGQRLQYGNQEKRAAQQAIQIAYQGCSAKERAQLQQLEEQLKHDNPLQS